MQHLTEHFTILEPPNPSINEFCKLQKRRSTGFQAIQWWNARSGMQQPLSPFTSNFWTRLTRSEMIGVDLILIDSPHERKQQKIAIVFKLSASPGLGSVERVDVGEGDGWEREGAVLVQVAAVDPGYEGGAGLVPAGRARSGGLHNVQDNPLATPALKREKRRKWLHLSTLPEMIRSCFHICIFKTLFFVFFKTSDDQTNDLVLLHILVNDYVHI